MGVFCTNCGQELPSGVNVKYCPNCGKLVNENNIEDFGTKTKKDDEDKSKSFPPQQPSVVTQLPYKSPGTAALIAFIGGIFGLPGIGHIYIGKLGKGIGILILGLFLYAMMIGSIFGFPPMALIFGIAYLIMFIWQIFSARGQARQFNELVKETRKEPW